MKLGLMIKLPRRKGRGEWCKRAGTENAKDTLGNILKAVLTDVGEEDQDPYEIIFKSTEDIE